MTVLAATPLFSAVAVQKSYGTRRVLDGVSFDVERGECFAILGRSGTGKSVTLRLLDGLEPPDQGQVLFDGQDISDLPEDELVPIRRRISMLFQSGALFDSMNVFENVAFPLREHTELDEESIAAKVREKLGVVGLEGVEERMPSDLSGGMRKRAALARSLALDPAAVLFDEPTTGLDPITSASIGRLIRRTQALQGSTSIVVTHDIPLVRQVADRLTLLEGGKLRFLGTLAEAEASDDPVLSAFFAGRELEEMVDA